MDNENLLVMEIFEPSCTEEDRKKVSGLLDRMEQVIDGAIEYHKGDGEIVEEINE